MLPLKKTKPLSLASIISNIDIATLRIGEYYCNILIVYNNVTHKFKNIAISKSIIKGVMKLEFIVKFQLCKAVGNP